MLQLQRASAGSGKTYTLAKKYIWYLITTDYPDGRVRLRTTRELGDSLRSILAVTFTNKATNEMKARIVDRLRDLAAAGDADSNPKLLKDTPYLKEFMETLGVRAGDVAETAGEALRILLNRYSDFSISTIDSFFQRVLRTFAYETDLNDNYQLELDSDYVANVGLETTLERIDSAEQANPETEYWIRSIISEHYLSNSKANWNPFSRSRAKHSLYSNLTTALKCLDKEDFKEIKAELDNYLETTPNLRNVYRQSKEEYTRHIERHSDACRQAARDFSAEVERLGAEKLISTNAQKAIAKVIDGPKTNASDLIESLEKHTEKFVKKSGTKAEKALAATVYPQLLPFYREIISRLNDMATDKVIVHWNLYSDTFPYLGLVQQVRHNINEYLSDNNIVELAETNSILRRIIADDDTPFIYERLGTRLNHYLIDEFQDTSRLQWQNLRPLISESLATGHDNLIIGDAKQSIYRFRNADPTLIISTVRDTFGDSCELRGMSLEENTNWRSKRRIVEFNNFFFRALSARYATTESGRLDFTDIYSNTVQYPHNQEKSGYIRVTFPEVKLPDSSYSAPSDEELLAETDYYASFGPLVSSLLKRGYRQHDIAFLVWRNDDGISLINGLISYNDTLPEGEEMIQFVSEQSLLISSSEAVATIISVLEAINNGTHIEIRTGTEANAKGAAEWRNIACNFNFFARRHPELNRSQQIVEFLKHPDVEDSITEMLAGMQTVALPAIVESIVMTFVDDRTRRADVAFISAFQDLVLGFCEGPFTNISSFLDWWHEKGVNKSINSPDEMNAVRIMTVHKSKGLEFPVVILPRVDKNIEKSSPGWSWVPPYPIVDGLPPYLPVETSEKLVGTDHEKLWETSHDLDILDHINTVYVAFTRAIDELYIYSPANCESSKSKGSNIRKLLADILEGAKDQIDTFGEEAKYMGAIYDIEQETDSDGILVYNLGTPGPYTLEKDEEVSAAEGSPTEKEDKEKEGDAFIMVEGYNVKPAASLLAYHGKREPNPTAYASSPDEKEEETEEDIPTEEEAKGMQLERLEELDPRSEGNMLHRIMQDVIEAKDLDRAARRLYLDGTVNHEDALRMEEMLRGAISHSDLTAGWFDGSHRVLTERSLLSRRGKTRRPDRIMIDPDGTATVVDYKFGSAALVRRHCRDVKNYMHLLLETGLANRVRGYVWYVREDKVVTLDPVGLGKNH